MTTPERLGGTAVLADDLSVRRMGYGAMRLAGPGVYGPPPDREAALGVLRAAVDAGVTHIDTSDFYGPAVVNELIHEALHPYPEDLRIVTKVGSRRTPDKGWPSALAPDDLRRAVEDDLEHLGLDALDVVNLRVGGQQSPRKGSIARPFEALLAMQEEGLIKHLGVSNVTLEQVAEARAVGPIVCVQNSYNVAARGDDRLVDLCADEEIAFVPFFPLGGFSPVQSDVLDEVAADLDATPMQVALAWLLQRSPALLLIPGTSNEAHLRENLDAAELELPPEAVERLDAIG